MAIPARPSGRASSPDHAGLEESDRNGDTPPRSYPSPLPAASPVMVPPRGGRATKAAGPAERPADRLDRACHLPDARGQRAVHLPVAGPPGRRPPRRPGARWPPDHGLLDWEAAYDRGAVPGAGRDRPLAPQAGRLRLLPGAGMDVALQHAPRGGARGLAATTAAASGRSIRSRSQTGPSLPQVEETSTQVQVVFTRRWSAGAAGADSGLINTAWSTPSVRKRTTASRWRIGGTSRSCHVTYLMCEVTSRQVRRRPQPLLARQRV